MHQFFLLFSFFDLETTSTEHWFFKPIVLEEEKHVTRVFILSIDEVTSILFSLTNKWQVLLRHIKWEYPTWMVVWVKN